MLIVSPVAFHYVADDQQLQIVAAVRIPAPQPVADDDIEGPGILLPKPLGLHYGGQRLLLVAGRNNDGQPLLQRAPSSPCSLSGGMSVCGRLNNHGACGLTLRRNHFRIH